MAKNIPKPEHPNRLVDSGKHKPEVLPLYFVFDRFKASAINIKGEFNSFYKNEEEYIRKISIFIGKALPLLSQENSSLFRNSDKMLNLHLHKVLNKCIEIKKVLKEYGFPDMEIDNIFEGAELYQFEVPYENGAFRVVFERISSNIISFLFFDPNHHIYLNRDIVDKNGSLFYDFCPTYKNGLCKRMDYFDTCFAFEYLDFAKYESSFSNDFSPD